MIPPASRSATNVENALRFVYENEEHEGEGWCGDAAKEAASRESVEAHMVLCLKCVSRNALLDVGWRLNQYELAEEHKLGLVELPN